MSDSPRSGSSYAATIAELCDALDGVETTSTDDRARAVSTLEAIARALTIKASELLAEERDGRDVPRCEELYEGMRVYDLLEAGWRDDLYSGASEIDWLDERLFNSLVDIVRATGRTMPGFDLSKRAFEALSRHYSHPTGRLLGEEWFNTNATMHRLFQGGASSKPDRSDGEDDATQRMLQEIGELLDDTDWRWRPLGDPDAPIGVHEYARALIDWRFDDRAVPEYWLQRAELTERALGIDTERHRLLGDVLDNLPLAACPLPWGGEIGLTYLETPMSFNAPVSRARQTQMFEAAQVTYRAALQRFIVDLVTTMVPDVTARFTTLRSLWALGLPEVRPVVDTPWDES